jgi:hypothetical protein
VHNLLSKLYSHFLDEKCYFRVFYNLWTHPNATKWRPGHLEVKILPEFPLLVRSLLPWTCDVFTYSYHDILHMSVLEVVKIHWKIQCSLELSVKYWYPIFLPLWSPPHAIVILYFIVYSLHFNHSIPNFEQTECFNTLFWILNG